MAIIYSSSLFVVTPLESSVIFFGVKRADGRSDDTLAKKAPMSVLSSLMISGIVKT